MIHLPTDNNMKVIIDSHMLGQKEAGNETYILGLLNGIDQICRDTERFEIYPLINKNYSLPIKCTNFRNITLSSSSDIRRVFIDIPLAQRNVNADITHVTYNASPFIRGKLVVTVHDVIFRIFPQYFSPKVRLILSTLLPLSMHRANIILTISLSSKKEITHYYPFTRNKIISIPIGPGAVVNTPPNTSEIAIYTRKKDFILAVGTIQPRKNIARLIDAYTLLRRRSSTAARLIIVGKADWQHSKIYEKAMRSPYHDDIVFTGYLDDTMLAALYRQCSVFVYPSLYEGFGLPVVEAMACGAPVITSNVSSLPEVAGSAALLVNPYSVSDLADAIEQVLSDPNLQDKLRSEGVKQASKFSWSRTARETLQVYEKIVNS